MAASKVISGDIRSLLAAALQLLEKRWAEYDSLQDGTYTSSDTDSYYVSATGALRKLYPEERGGTTSMLVYGPTFYLTWDLLDECAERLYMLDPAYKLKHKVHASVGYSPLDKINSLPDSDVAKKAVLTVYRKAIAEYDGAS